MDYSNFDYSTTSELTPEQMAVFTGGMGVFAGGMMAMMMVISLVVYVVLALSLYKIAIKTKTNVEHAWFAWIPLLNVILMLNVAGYSGWYIFVLMIPFVNIVFAIYVWMKISKACGKPDFLGLLMLVPLANIILPLYLAYGDTLDKK
jgi:hypothetical protein